MPVRYYLFIALLILGAANNALCQAPVLKFKHITDEQGLSNTSVECIFQDSRGFMWFGTLDGLNRYDGYKIVVYRNNPKDSTTISNNSISCITEDAQHRLWVGTANGLNSLDQATDKFTRYGTNSISNSKVNDVYLDRARNLWVATQGGLDFLKLGYNAFTHFVHQVNNGNSLSSNIVNAIAEDGKGNIWIATTTGLNLYRSAARNFTLVNNFGGANTGNSADYNNIQKVKADQQGNLWLINNDRGLVYFNPVDKSAKYFTHQDNNPHSLGSDILKDVYIERDGSVWTGGINAGLNLYTPADKSFRNYHHEPDNGFSLSQKSVHCIYQDKQGNLWVGTYRGGLNLYSPQLGRFMLYKQTVSPSSLSYDDIRSFYQDKQGKIWVGADGGGLDLFNENQGAFKHFRYDAANMFGISSSAIISITGNSDGKLWISTWQGGLNLFDPESNVFTHYRHSQTNKNSISSDFVRKAFEDSEHHTWIATDVGGVNLFDKGTQRFTRLTADPEQKTRVWGTNIIDINEDDHKNIWILTLDSGINCYNLVTKHIKHYLYTKGESSADIAFAFTDSKGRFWIGRKGLYLFDSAHDRFTPYTELAGLSTEYIKGILEDDHGNLWISTSNGITKFNPDTHAFKKFNAGDGLQGLEFEVGSCLKAKNGQMFFGGVNGFNVFFPDEIKLNPYLPPVYLTDFQILNKDVPVGGDGSPLKRNISFTKKISLGYNQSTFSILFSALNYVVPENNRYRYKLVGFDKNWISAGSERKASYTNIDPGTYTFMVQASNNDGLWNNAGTGVEILISPPFWSTLWFRAFILLILGACAYVILYFRREFELRALEERKNEEYHQVQLQFFTNISHEFRTPLSLILGPLEKITHETSPTTIAHYYKTIHRNANRLMNLINELMDFRKVESGALKLKVRNADLTVFLNNIVEEFSDLSESKTIRLKINDPDKFEHCWFDSMLLEKIILNLLNNAFKYTAADGQIDVEVFYSLAGFTPSFDNELVVKNVFRAENYFYIRVKDNGIGISKESIDHLFERYYRITSTHLGSGVGLAFVKSLAMLHKGDIFVCSERHKGTEFIIGLPYAEVNYTADERWQPTNAEGGISLETPAPKFADSVITDEPELTGLIADEFKHRILLVDDNHELRDFLRGTLASRYEVLEATDGVSGLAVLGKEYVDLIISDIMMPGMNGIDFCKAVKNNMEMSHLPFIMLTAKDALASKIEGVESGADIYLSKPVSINLLLLTIRNVFEQQQKQKDRYLQDYYTEAKGLVNSSKDKEFMDKLVQIIELQLVNPELDVDLLCREIYMSKTKLYQKIKSITGQSIAEFVRTFRLKKAIRIMTHEDVLLTEVTYRVGFIDASYFSRVFKKEYGKTPTQFLQEIKKQAKP